MSTIMNRVVFKDKDGNEKLFTTAAYPVETEPCIFDKQAMVDQQYRDVLRITLADTNYGEVCTYFKDDAEFSIRQNEVTGKDTEGNDVYGDVDYPKTEYSILGDIVCHKDGKITVYMGKLTAHEEEVKRLEEENAQLLFENLTGETDPDLPDPGTDENTDPAPDTGNESGSETDPTVNPSSDPGTTTK